MKKLLAGVALATMTLAGGAAEAAAYAQYVVAVDGDVFGPLGVETDSKFFGQIVITLADLANGFAIPCEGAYCGINAQSTYLQITPTSDTRSDRFSLRLNFTQAADQSSGLPNYLPATLGSGSYDFSPSSVCGRAVNPTLASCGFRTATSVRLISSSVSATPFDAAVGIVSNISVVPEPASWALMIAGFGMIGGAMRRQRAAIAFA